MSGQTVAIITSCISAGGVIVAAFIATIGARHARDSRDAAVAGRNAALRVDDAVNNQHPEAPKLIDRVVGIDQRTKANHNIIHNEIRPEMDRNRKARKVLFDHVGVTDPTEDAAL